MTTIAPGKMPCPKCGAEMNHHCDKLFYGTTQSGEVETELGGLLEEFHACPRCGTAASRPARGTNIH